MGYTPSFTPQYENGWEDLPLETTPITADALNGYDNAIENVEEYLASDDTQSNLADSYDPDEGTYAVGDYAIYEGTLYKCTTAVSEPEDFDSDKWESCLITDEMGSGSGGSTVTITPTLQSGTKIADYSIDGTSGALYAPNGGGGASALEDLTDVNLTSLADGQIIKWDSTSSKWVNADESGGGGVFPDFNNVIQAQTTISTSATYTATEDCFVQYDFIIPASTASSILTSNNDVLFNMYSASQLVAYDGIMFIPKGTTITLTGGSSGSSVSKYTVYGVISTGGGGGNHYTTDEQVIGTYLGDTLYQKTFHILKSDFTSSGTNTYSYSWSLPFNSIVSIDAIMNTNNAFVQIPNGTINQTYANYISSVTTSALSMYMNATSVYANLQYVDITLKYTKTS